MKDPERNEMIDRLENILKVIKDEEDLRLVKYEELNFKCLENCGNCCSLPVLLPEKEAEKTKMPYILLDKKRGIAMLKTKRGNCIALNPTSKTCDCYENRPSVCRAYPIYINPFTEEIYMDECCPGWGKGEKLNSEKIQAFFDILKDHWDNLGFSVEERKLFHKYLYRQ